MAIQVLNETLGIELGVKDVGHDDVYPSGIPLFLKQHEGMTNLFLQKRSSRAPSLEDAFHQPARTSPQGPRVSSAIRSVGQSAVVQLPKLTFTSYKEMLMRPAKKEPEDSTEKPMTVGYPPQAAALFPHPAQKKPSGALKRTVHRGGPSTSSSANYNPRKVGR